MAVIGADMSTIPTECSYLVHSAQIDVTDPTCRQRENLSEVARYVLQPRMPTLPRRALPPGRRTDCGDNSPPGSCARCDSQTESAGRSRALNRSGGIPSDSLQGYLPVSVSPESWRTTKWECSSFWETSTKAATRKAARLLRRPRGKWGRKLDAHQADGSLRQAMWLPRARKSRHARG